MIKKRKILLSTISVVTVATIVPVIVVSCGTSTIDDKTKIETNITALKNLKLTANDNTTVTAAQAATLLGENATSLSILDKYFNIKTVESIATQNSVKATYSAVLSTTTPPVVNTNIDTTAQDANTLTISVKLSIGADTNEIIETQNIFITDFPNPDQAIVNSYIYNLDNPSGTAIITGKNIIAPTDLTSENINLNLNNVPKLPSTPAGLSLSYSLSNANNAGGSIDVIISVSSPLTKTKTSKLITISGFRISTSTLDNTIVSDYVTLIQSLTGDKVIKGVNTIAPSTLTPANISEHLLNVPVAPAGVTLAFQISNASDTAGTISIIIDVSKSGATTKSTTSIIVGGFAVNTQAAIASYIRILDELATGIIIGKNTILPSALTDENVGANLEHVPAVPDGLKITYATSNPNSETGTIDITISASAPGSTAIASNPITISGFLTTNQNAINTYVTNFNSATIAGINTIVPSTIAASLPSGNINTYFTGIAPFPAGVTAVFNLTDINDTAGTVSLSITLSATNATTTTTNVIPISGFKILTTGQQANLAILQTISTNLKAATIVTTTKTAETSQVASTAISAMTNLTLDQLAPYFTTTQVSDLITNSATSTIAIETLTEANKLDGTLVFSVNLSLGSSSDEATLQSTFTVGGFKKVPNFTLTGTLAANSVYANYWATTPPTANLGNSKTENSLYIPGSDGNNGFNSSATLANTGTEFPSFITNIAWPDGLSSTDVSSWTMTGTTAGVATYNIVFNNNKTAELTFTGFMNINRVTSLKLISINKTADIASLTTPANGPLTSAVTDPTKGIASINWNGFTQSIVGNTLSYRIENSSPTDGTINVILVFASGVVLSLPVSGFLHS